MQNDLKINRVRKKMLCLGSVFLMLLSLLTPVLSGSAGAAGDEGFALPAAAGAEAAGKVPKGGQGGKDLQSKNGKEGERRLIPGGMAFGVKFFTEGVLVVGFSDGSGNETATANSPAYAAGLRVNDVILKADGKVLSGSETLTEAVDASGGRPMELVCRRDGKEFTVTITPKKDADGGFHTGMWVRDGGAGIGTVTFIDPRTGAFGGLGHGICDNETGKPVPLGRGVVMGVTISGLRRGSAGTPGEIRGYFEPEKLGAVTGNTDCGVFGIFSRIPQTPYDALPLAAPSEVKPGKATILCTLDNGKICEYSVELSSIDKNADGGRCFSVKVTDPTLLELTGGIIQGMSGSPIIQNGKLVGAVTHVLINDPTSGYGIFIDNMLSNMPEALR